jgi:heme exporter protein D
VTGALYDMQGTYAFAFWICVGLIALSVLALWRAAPRKVRAVAGRMRQLRHEKRANSSDPRTP